MKPLRIALIQTRSSEDQSDTLERAEIKIAEAARSGASIICLQELFHTPYFCIDQDPRHFELAEPVPGPTTLRLAEAARRHRVFLIVPLFEHVRDTVYYNTAVVLDPEGQCIGKYRKMHIPQDPGFEEKFFFAPGDLGWLVFETPWGPMGVLICWDQWYPEAARLLALKGARVLFYPTAIGKIASEPEHLAFKQHQAWETVQRGHAIANGCFVAACNRVGVEGQTEFWGQSFVCDTYGSILAKGSAVEEQVVMAELDLGEQTEFRRMWPFFRDRRIDAYQDILNRVVE